MVVETPAEPGKSSPVMPWVWAFADIGGRRTACHIAASMTAMPKLESQARVSRLLLILISANEAAT